MEMLAAAAAAKLCLANGWCRHFYTPFFPPLLFPSSFIGGGGSGGRTGTRAFFMTRLFSPIPKTAGFGRTCKSAGFWLGEGRTAKVFFFVSSEKF